MMAVTVEANPPPAERGVRAGYRRFARTLNAALPKGLFARAVIIIITPVVLLQALVAFVFMERHWQTVTAQLSSKVVGEIAAIVDILAAYPQDAGFATVTRIAGERMGLSISVLPPAPLPAAGPQPFFSPLDRVLSDEIRRQIGKPFWIDTAGRESLVEIRIQLDRNVLRVFAPRSQTYVSNSLIFISWMMATSVVLLGIAIVFLRNQIRPILRLTAAVDNFGKGRAVPDFQPRGAREVRQATVAFHEMRRRVERQIEQRTAMLAGVSHDLRTMLTRFRLELAIMEDTADVEALKKDVDDMNRMLEGYLAFARGDSGEDTLATDIDVMLRDIAREAKDDDHVVAVAFAGADPMVKVRPQSFRRCISNLVVNAKRHAGKIAIAGVHAEGHLTVTVDDDGPGIPFEEREAVFKPFYRLDNARTLDQTGTGLGLPIARDIARSHGGDVTLGDGPLGGLRVTVAIPA